MTRILHLIVGPEEHGVVRHATAIAQACRHDIQRAHSCDEVVVPAGYDIVHFAFTDRLFGPDCESAAKAFALLADAVLESGSQVSVTVHDVPVGSDALQARRRAAYRLVLAHATGIVVSSNVELGRLQGLFEAARSVRVIPLPVHASSAPPAQPSGHEVAVLGFVFPDRGYEHVLDELPEGHHLLAIGRPADGHDDLPSRIAQHASRVARRWRLTGFVPDEVLPSRLATVAIPVAPNRRVTASASIATWLSHGRRPLVPECDYTCELARRWPDTLHIYDPDRAGALRAAIERAALNPESTVLAPGVVPGPSLADVATTYSRHFEVCAPPAPRPAGGGRFFVPDNEWRLLDGYQPLSPPTVSVVIPYYESQKQLDLVLTGLDLQTHPRTKTQVIVADDGSSQPPDLSAAGSLETHLIRQENKGFRAAAARNLGAAIAEGDILAFLDGDTVPEPDYLAQLTRLPALLADALVVGRRRHGDLADWSPRQLRRWLLQPSASGAPRELSEPAWLADGYRRSKDLSVVDVRSYRFIISAVAALNREFFAELDGFCEEFTSYGGEDWELAHRAYSSGAVLAYVPSAVAWHDGVEWAERDLDRSAIKEVETQRLAKLLPDREARGPGDWMPFPATVVRMRADDLTSVERTAHSAFASGADCGFWLDGPHADAIAGALRDNRIRVVPVPSQTLLRARVMIDLSRPADLRELPALEHLAETFGHVCTPVGTVCSSRAIGRAQRYAACYDEGFDAALQSLFGRLDVDRPASSAHGTCV